MPAQPLTAHEREEIRVGIERGDTITATADRVGRHRCTVSAEVSRNGGRDVYNAVAAQERADVRRSRPKVAVLVADPTLAGYVADRLDAKDSPMTIARELAAGTNGVRASISHETIYRAVYAPRDHGLPADAYRSLHRRRRRRKHRHHADQPTKLGPLGQFNPIAQRPRVADDRTEVGHLEGDLILGTHNRSAIITLFDRASRYLWLAGLPGGHTAAETLDALIATIERIPLALRRTLTWDQGREMASWDQLAKTCHIDIYFADAHSPWQRPTNENGNGLIRRWCPKGTNLNTHTPDDLQRIEHRINTIPRRTLGWKTAHDLYTTAVATTLPLSR